MQISRYPFHPNSAQRVPSRSLEYSIFYLTPKWAKLKLGQKFGQLICVNRQMRVNALTYPPPLREYSAFITFSPAGREKNARC